MLRRSGGGDWGKVRRNASYCSLILAVKISTPPEIYSNKLCRRKKGPITNPIKPHQVPSSVANSNDIKTLVIQAKHKWPENFCSFLRNNKLTFALNITNDVILTSPHCAHRRMLAAIAKPRNQPVVRLVGSIVSVRIAPPDALFPWFANPCDLLKKCDSLCSSKDILIRSSAPYAKNLADPMLYVVNFYIRNTTLNHGIYVSWFLWWQE